VNYLTSGEVPQRRGNGHPNIVPYEVYQTADGHVILAVGNDSQFKRFCSFIEKPELADDPRFATNPARLENRDALNAILRPAVQALDTGSVIAGLEELKVPVGPVRTLDQVFASDQVAARQMQISMQAEPGEVQLIGNPLNLSRTPVTYRSAPPVCGADTQAVLNAENPFED
jgi:crotonobetainyl-CoA:carnitine CoA-transferase CaiB-like acyl-CoA transferase